MYDVIVIGAGITGLTTASDLAAAGLDVIVLERAVRVGGKAVSERFGGFLMEHGPSTVNAAMPETEAIAATLDLADSRIDLGANVRKRYLLDDGRLTGISTHPAGFMLSGYLPFSARLSMLGEIFRPPRRDGADESVYDFTARRFGAVFAEKVMDPMIGGIFMGDSHDLSLRAVFPKLAEFERDHGSVMGGMLRARKKGDPGRRLFSWPGGIGTLPVALAQRLGGRVRTGIAVTRLHRLRTGIRVATAVGDLTARAVVLIVQPHVAAQLVAPLDPLGAEAASAIPAPPAAVVFAGYRRQDVAHPLDGMGYLSTSGSGQISGVQFCSTMFSGRAPEGYVSIAAYVGGARGRDLAASPATALSHAVHDELARILGIRSAPVASRVRQWPLGLPQYQIGHAARRETLETASDRCGGLYLAGNYLGGVSVGHCIAAGQRAARAIIATRMGKAALSDKPDLGRAGQTSQIDPNRSSGPASGAANEIS